MGKFKFLFVAALLALAACVGSNDRLLFVDAVDYEALNPQAGCLSDPADPIYWSCIDTETLYTAALESAKVAGNPLMVIWGFNECPYCKVFDGENFNPERPWKTADFIKKLTPDQRAAMSKEAQESFQISVVRLYSRSDNGLAFADKLGVTAMARERGWHRVWSPFVVFVNPQTGDMTSESEWDAKDIYCDWPANIAVSLEKLGMVKDGPPLHVRKRCSKS